MAIDKSMLARVRAIPARAKDWFAYYAHGLYREISDKNVFLFAQAIAFKVFITLVPVVVLATGITGQILDRVLTGENAFGRIREVLVNFLPAYESDQILGFLQQFLNASRSITLVGVIGLLVAAVTLATTLRIAVANAFEQDWHNQRSIIGGRLFDLRMVAQVGLFFLLTMALTVAAQALSAEGQAMLNWTGMAGNWIGAGWRQAFNLLGLTLPFFFTAVMFFQLFYFVPQPHPPKRSAMAGALLTAVLWEAAKQSFTFYAEYVGGFARYGGAKLDQGGVDALGTGFGLFLALIIWIYYSGAVLMLGAIVASLHERRQRMKQGKASGYRKRVSSTEERGTPDRDSSRTAPASRRQMRGR